MNFPQDLKFTKDHEWAKITDQTAVVGITDYAQEKLGSIVFVELPPLGKSFRQGEILATIDSVKAVAEVYAPLSGQVTEINEGLKDNPEWINQDAYGKGWIAKLKIDDAAEANNLLSADDYQKFIAEEGAKE